MKRIWLGVLVACAALWAKQAPEWVESKVCTQSHCAIGQASKQEGETSAIARALKELRLSLSTSVQAEYDESTNASGQSVASERVRIYAKAHNIGYKILARYEDSKSVYVKIQYDPSKKLVDQAPAPEFKELENLEKLCEDSTLDGYYCVSLGDKYQKGELELAKNDKIALKYYKKACLMGTLEGCVLAGEIALKESKKSAQWYYSHACENGYGLACAKAAGLEEAARKKLDLYTQGCKLNDALSCAYLGEVYALGLANLQKNPAKAKSLYKQSAQLSEYGDGAVLLLGASFDTASMQKLCDRNNARACAALGEKNSDPTLLQKAFALGSAQGAYALALLAKESNARIKFLTHSCEVGAQSDFVKACELLGDTLLESDKSRAQEYYATSCNHLFYEQSACQKLYNLAPNKCQNESVCLSFASESVPAGVAVSGAVDAIIDGDSELDSRAKRSSKAPESTKLESIKRAIFAPREPKMVRIFGELMLGANSIDFPRIRGMHEVMDSPASFMGAGKLGVEISTAKQPLAFYAAPFIELAWQGLFDAEEFSRREDDEDGRVSALLFGSGIQAGVQYKIWRFYGVVDYLTNFTRISHDVSVPLQNILGIGAGIGCELSFMRIGVQYMYQSYAYNAGNVYEGGRHNALVLDSTKVRSSAHAVFLTLGVGF